jgi:chemotaxis protein methyltransferase CheR
MNRSYNEDIEIGISSLRKLTETVRQKYNFDLGIYASTSLKRRLSKVMQINDMRNPDELVEKLSSHPLFFPVFQSQMIIEGTEFFRDPAFWRLFRDEICKALSGNILNIKIWVPGCSTGEEVISTAITLQEAGLYNRSVIFASDINKEIIELSRKRVYDNHLLEISENNYRRFKEDESADLSKYFTRTSQGFTFSSQLYDNVVYEIFNDDEPQSIKSVNMILYRNKFIYYTAPYEEKLLEVFAGKLMLNGYLAIGNKENISFCKDARKFTAVNEIEKIFRKTAN